MRVALAIMRIQPLHKGHTLLIQRMLEDNDVVIIGIGSAQLSGVMGNPFPWDIRKQMIDRVFGRRLPSTDAIEDLQPSDRLRIVPIADIGAMDDTSDWVNYVLEKIESMKMPLPTDYYGGSKIDARWYWPYFVGESPIEYNSSEETIIDSGDRRIHLLNRDSNNFISATEIRTLIEMRDPEWKLWVPARIHDIVEEHYPGKFRRAIHADEFPETAPDGTYLVRDGIRFQWIQNQWKPIGESKTFPKAT
ncbi:MAG: hypothetical protein WC284_12005 [Candidimonas sp.]